MSKIINLLKRLEDIIIEFENREIKNKYKFFNHVLEDLISLIPNAEKGSVFEYKTQYKVCIAQYGYDDSIIEKIKFPKDLELQEKVLHNNAIIIEEITNNVEQQKLDEETKEILKKIDAYKKFNSLRGHVVYKDKLIYQINLDNFHNQKFTNIEKELFNLYLHFSKVYVHQKQLITELTETNAEINAIIQSSPTAIVKIDKQGTIKSSNRAFKEMLHSKNQADLKELLPKAKEKINKSLEEMICNNSLTHKDIICTHKDKQTYAIKLFRINKTTDDFYAAIHDISKYRDLENALMNSLFDLANIIGSIAETNKKDEFGVHVKRVAAYSELTIYLLKKEFSNKHEYVAMDNFFIDGVKIGAMLHDVGKFKVDSKILLKPSKLTAQEFEEIKKHPIYGIELIYPLLNDPTFSKLKTSLKPIKDIIKNIILYHHENYDGSGYPYGLKDEAIPIEARIVKLADVYDALTHKRAYKRAFTHEEALTIIEDEYYKFDPNIIEVFFKYNELYLKINEKLNNGKNGLEYVNELLNKEKENSCEC